MLSPTPLADAIRAEAASLGFDACRFASAAEAWPAGARLAQMELDAREMERARALGERLLVEAPPAYRPIAAVIGAPSREITAPVMKLGANIETMCHWMAKAASSLVCPHT